MKGFKTIAYGLLIAGIAIFSNGEMQEYFALHIPTIGGLLGTGVIVLRALTSSAIFKGE